MKGIKLTEKEKTDILTDYATGNYTYSELHRKHKRGKETIRNLCLDNGYKSKTYSETSKRYTIDENYFDKIDTEEKAYTLGLLYADGCNHIETNQVFIKLQIGDEAILKTIKSNINSSKPLYYIKPLYRVVGDKSYLCQAACKLVIVNKHISDRLVELGCTPRKSLTLTFPNKKQVPKNLQRHFIRGYFDGDGSIHIDKENTGYIKMLGTGKFLTSVQAILIKELGFNKTKIYKDKSTKNDITSTLQYGGNIQSATFGKWLYKDATIYLERKHEKFKTLRNYGQ